MSEQGPHLLLGVTGSVAAFRAVELASTLTQQGWRVTTIMTEWAQRFVAPLSFSSVTGRPVYTSLECSDPACGTDHVSVARSGDILAIVPATANTMAKLAAGLADNLLTLTVLAFRGPVVIAPAMNVSMYESPPVQENIKLLSERGYRFVGPAEGRLACGEVGKGRLAPLSEIQQVLRELLR